MDSLYSFIKEAHSGWRWIVLVLAIAAVIDFAMGLISKRSFKPIDNRLSLFYMISCDIQLLLGLLLYFVLSPVTQSAFQDGNEMSDPTARFYAVEHPVTMLLAIVFAHVGRIASKKASADSKKFQRGLIWFLLSLIFMLSRMPW
jgi:hypothetical protein